MREGSSRVFQKGPEDILIRREEKRDKNKENRVERKTKVSGTVWKSPEFYDEKGQPKKVMYVDLVGSGKNCQDVQMGRYVEDIDVEENVGAGVNDGVGLGLESLAGEDNGIHIEQHGEGMRKAAAREIESGYGVRERRQDASKWRGKGKKLNKPSRGGKEEEFRKVA